MPKTLVTGASGHIGNNIVRLLLREGREVRAMVRGTSNREALAGLDVEIVEGDIQDAESLKRALSGCSVVHHTAAAYRIWSRDPDREIVRPTVDGTRNLLEAAAQVRVTNIVYVSSAGTVGFTTDGLPLTEGSFHTAPALPYIKAKVEAEKLAMEFCRHTGVRLVLVLPGFVLGPHFYSLNPSVLQVKNFIDPGMPLYFEGGFSIVDVRDVARGCLLAEELGRSGERYILAGENATIRTLLELLAQITGLPSPRWKAPVGFVRSLASLIELLARVVPFEPPITRSAVQEFGGCYASFDSSKAQQELGYTFRPKEETIYDTVCWLLETGFVRESRKRKVKLSRPSA